MAYERKRIAILFCGGTTIDERDRAGDSVKRPSDVGRWLTKMAEMEMIAHVDPFFVYGGPGTDIGSREWSTLATTIGREYRHFDGFLLIHSLDTIAYTAAALAFMLQNLEKPVVLTGSLIRTKEERRSAFVALGHGPQREFGTRANLMNALQVAASELAEVCVVFGSSIFRGTQIVRSPVGSAPLFRSYDGKVFGKIDFGTQFYAEHRRRGQRALRVQPAVDDEIIQFDYRLGKDFGALQRAMQSRAHGLFLSVSETTAFPPAFLATLRRAEAQGIPVVLYVPGLERQVAAQPFIVLDRLSQVAASVKFRWALGQTRNRRRLQTLMMKDLAGEFVRRSPVPSTRL